MNRGEALIRHHRMQPHPEGGHFVRVQCSDAEVRSPISGERRAAMTHIYFLLRRGEVSRLHQVCHDELWCVYEGAPLRLIRGDGHHFDAVTIGPGCDHYQALVPGGRWQAAESRGDFTLCGCTVAPGFDFADFALMAPHQAAEVPTCWQRFI
ncbi:cupin domain-containing protein [Kushneria aurantia]|uniref:Cupin domain-containing protein n=1 Tax=Kushneria aurantia TaxID=504092 RepID=A0ABV6G2Z7_9GAMM|nr:cupin domain-containing protein [Kushneria aurantia]